MNTDTFEELIALAKDWRTFSEEANGWECQDYEGDGIKVECYFADRRNNYSTVTLHMGHNKEARVAFHSTIKFGDLSLSSIKDLEKMVIKATNLLNVEKTYHTKTSSKQKADERAIKIENAERHLAELKEEAA